MHNSPCKFIITSLYFMQTQDQEAKYHQMFQRVQVVLVKQLVICYFIHVFARCSSSYLIRFQKEKYFNMVRNKHNRKVNMQTVPDEMNFLLSREGNVKCLRSSMKGSWTYIKHWRVRCRLLVIRSSINEQTTPEYAAHLIVLLDAREGCSYLRVAASVVRITYNGHHSEFIQGVDKG